MWQVQPFETYIEGEIKAKRSSEGEALWTRYVHTRSEIVSAVLPYIASQEPNLSDHGIDHIADVISRIGRVLGYEEAPAKGSQSPPVTDLTPEDLMLLLLGGLLHDIGNIAGREKHNLVGAEVWRDSGTSFHSWTPTDRRTILAVCRAHTGKSKSGSKDTLSELATGTFFLNNHSVRAGEIAAVVRFADELAEGPQRTSDYLVRKALYPRDNRVFHHYASITEVHIDFHGARVALSYHIDVDAPFLGENISEQISNLTDLLRLLFSRIVKLDFERVLARHYAPRLLNFRETSVSLNFSQSGLPHAFQLENITLNDFNTKAPSEEVVRAIDPCYNVGHILEALFGEGYVPQ